MASQISRTSPLETPHKPGKGPPGEPEDSLLTGEIVNQQYADKEASSKSNSPRVHPQITASTTEKPDISSEEKDVWLETSGVFVATKKQTGNRKCLQHLHLICMWWSGLICCCVVVAALVDLVVTLAHYDHKPLPKWPYGISNNACIAIFVVLMKCAAGLVLADGISHLNWTNLWRPRSLHNFAVHDEASRGPWGALLLLWSNRRSAVNVSSLGALVMVLILLLDPFSQQIVRYYDCTQHLANATATIPRTNVHVERGYHLGPISESIPWPFRNAFHQGLFATIQPRVNTSCRTGNCTFSESYTTLGYCSSCKDVTPQLIRTDSRSNDSDFRTNITMLPMTNQNGNHSRNFALIRGESDRAWPSLMSQMGNGEVDTIEVLRWHKPNSYSGYRCSLWPCLETFSASIVAGDLRERMENATGPQDDVFSRLKGTTFNTADLDCVGVKQKELLRELYDFNETTRWLPYNISAYNSTSAPELNALDPGCNHLKEDARKKYCGTSNGSGSIDNQTILEAVPAECIYTVRETTMNSVYTLLQDMFNGTLMEDKLQFYEAQDGPAALQAIWNAGSGNGTLDDMTNLFRNISDAVTTHIRTVGPEAFSNPAEGQVLYTTTCIRIRWGWVLYSATTVGLTLIFFVGMVLQARIDQSRLRREWSNEDEGTAPPFHDFKSNALTLLFHGLDKESLEQTADSQINNRKEDLEKEAKKVAVRLVATDQGWKLRSV